VPLYIIMLAFLVEFAFYHHVSIAILHSVDPLYLPP
jgi:hypothetical protein